MSELSLNQISNLVDLIVRDTEHLAKHFEVSDSEEVWNKIEAMNEKQYKYFMALYINNKFFKLNSLMENLGFQHKEQ